MKNYKKMIVGSIMTAIIISVPLLSFAKDNDKNENRGNSYQEQNKEKQIQKQENKNNWFWSNWFNNKNLKEINSIPVITNLTDLSIKSNKATIKWETSVRSNSYIWYSTVSPVDTSIKPNMSRNDKVLKHKFELKKLQPNTKYYVVVGVANKAGQIKSTEISFTTNETVTQANNIPIITNVTGVATIKTGETVNYTVSAYDPQGKTLSYEFNWGDDSAIVKSTFNQAVTVGHVYSTIGTYNAKFTLINSDDKKVTYPIKITVTGVVTTDTKAPAISDVETKVSGKNVTILWKTDEPSTSNIFYSTVTPVDISPTTTQVVTNPSLVTKHSLSIPNLTSSTLYHFVLKSLDSSNNISLSSESIFATN